MTKRILLVDDELHILRAAEFKFKRGGYEVVCAVDGEEAWEEIQRAEPDIVVTDCQMPRLDGIELAERIHADPRLRGLPIVMLTAKGFELSPQELKERFGILDLVSKPFSPRELLRKVEIHLGISNEDPASSAVSGGGAGPTLNS